MAFPDGTISPWGTFATLMAVRLEGGGEPPRRLDISGRGRIRAAPGLKAGAYLLRRPRQGPPTVASEFPLPAMAWLGLAKLLYGESFRFPVIIS